jgi:serine/threonine-protein kinase RsbW
MSHEDVLQGSEGAPPRAAPNGDKPIVRVSTRFEARPAGLAELHTACERFFDAAQTASAPVRRADRVPMITAAAEIAANIILHACVLHPESQVTLTITRLPHTVEMVFEDPGRPYVETTAGRGLTVARAAVHSVEYERENGVNRWRLTRQTGLAASDDGAWL